MNHEIKHSDFGQLTSREVWDDVAGTYTLYDGAGNVTSTRPFTAAETTFYAQQASLVSAAAAAEATAAPNRASLAAKALTAIQTNIDALAKPDPTAANNTYVASTPTQAQANAQVKALTNQVNALVAQVTALTKQNTALIRMAIGKFDSTSGT